MKYRMGIICLVLCLMTVQQSFALLHFCTFADKNTDLDALLSPQLSQMTQDEKISARLELLKVQGKIEEQIGALTSALNEVSCGPYSAETVSMSAAALFLVAFFKESNFLRASSRGELNLGIINFERQLPTKGPGSKILRNKFKKYISDTYESMAKIEDRIIVKRLAFLGGVMAVSGSMAYFDVNCNDIKDLLIDLRVSSDSIGDSLDLLEQSMP